MAGPVAGRIPRYAFFAETCFYRTEHFLHDQMRGMAGVEVHAIARWGTCLDEFPTPSLFLAEEYRTPMLRVRNALLRRIYRDRPVPGRLPPHAVRRIVRHLRRHPVDLIYCLFGWNAALLLDVLDRLDRRVPLVFQAAGSDVTAASSFGGDYLGRLERAWDRAAIVLCGSRFLAGKLLELGAPEEKLAVHPIGIELPEPRGAEAGRDRPGFRALAVSRLSPVKGVLHTIRAFGRVAAAIPDGTLEIVGDGEDRQACEALIADLGLGAQVHLAGSQPLAGVHAAMRRSHVFLQHNVRTPEGQEESLGGSILEASAHRLPVIVTRSGGVSEAVEDGLTGVIVEPGDEDAMASALLAMSRDLGRRERLGQAGRALVERRFDLRERNRQLGAILHRVYEESLR